MSDEPIVYRYSCSECGDEFLSEDEHLKYCDADECLDKDIELNKHYNYQGETK